ncbi:MAG: hypothetical protein ACOY0S_02740 [Patescibacteria group bacterium]
MRRKRKIGWLVLGLVGLVGLVGLINFYPPSSWLLISIFFLTVLLSSFFLSLYLLHNVRRAILLSCGLTVFFLLRLFGLRQPLYLILLAASLVSLELLFYKR